MPRCRAGACPGQGRPRVGLQPWKKTVNKIRCGEQVGANIENVLSGQGRLGLTSSRSGGASEEQKRGRTSRPLESFYPDTALEEKLQPELNLARVKGLCR